MKHLPVTEWRAQLGQLRQGTEVVVVHYHRQPAALMVPIPPLHWQDAGGFVKQIMNIRDEYLQPPHTERPHPWLQHAHDPQSMPIEDARRGSALLFGIVMRNVPVVLTFYEYAGALMMPLPPGLPDAKLQEIGERIEAILRSSDITSLSGGWIT